MGDKVEDVVVEAALIIIGNEILSGRTQDINIQYIASGLNAAGIRLKEVRVIPDDEDVIIATVNSLRQTHRYVFTTGGIGPTHDDITAASIAKAFGVELKRDPRAVERLLLQIKPENLNEARLRMANIPDGADLIDNPVSHAPGFKIGNVYVMAGVPRIMQAMFDGVRASLRGGQRMLSKSVTIHMGEGAIAIGLENIQKQHPEVEIGSYPFTREGNFGTIIVIRGTNADRIEQIALDVARMAEAEGAKTEVDQKAPY